MLKEVLDKLPELEEGKNVCLALSGGLDSTTLVYVLVQKYGKDRVKTLSFDFGQRHKIELDMARKTTEFLGIEHNIIKLDYLRDIAKVTSALIDGSDLKPKTAEENAGDPQVNTYVPWRNAQFAFITAAYAESNNCRYIFQATNQVDCYGYFDTTIEFRDALNNVFLLNRQNPVTLITPFVELYKDEELNIAKELNELYDTDILYNTWSCYNGQQPEYNMKECGLVGQCNTCIEKISGYIQAGFTNGVIMDKFAVIDEAQLDEYRKQLE